MNPVREMQDVLLAGLRDDLVEKGWELKRDNQDGGALVLSGDGMRVVASLHVYEEKDLPPDSITEPSAWTCDECELSILGDDATGHGDGCSLNPSNIIEAFDPASVKVIDHVDKVGGQVWYGADCEEHGELMNGDWFDLATTEAAVDAHRKEHAP